MHTSRHYNWLYNLIILIEGLLVFGFIFLSIFAYANWDAVKSEIDYTASHFGKAPETPTAWPI